MEVCDDAEAAEAHRLTHTPLARVADLLGAIVDGVQRAVDEDRVRLPRERGAQQPVIEVGEHAPDLGAAEARMGGDDADGGHVAPPLKTADRPGGNLLQADDSWAVSGRQPDHLLEIRTSAGRDRVPMKEVPRPD